jgi:hypothetical protein
MDQFTDESPDVRGELARLEDRVEALSARLKNCRKLMAAGRGLVVASALLLAAALFGFIRFDAVALVGAIIGALGGLVLIGSNRTTAEQAQAQLAEAEAQRAALIDWIDPRVVN